MEILEIFIKIINENYIFVIFNENIGWIYSCWMCNMDEDVDLFMEDGNIYDRGK